MHDVLSLLTLIDNVQYKNKSLLAVTVLILKHFCNILHSHFEVNIFGTRRSYASGDLSLAAGQLSELSCINKGQTKSYKNSAFLSPGTSNQTSGHQPRSCGT